MVCGWAQEAGSAEEVAPTTYTESGGQGNPTFDTAQAIAVMLEKHGIACDLMHGFNWDKWTTGKPTERLALIPARLAGRGREDRARAGGTVVRGVGVRGMSN